MSTRKKAFLISIVVAWIAAVLIVALCTPFVNTLVHMWNGKVVTDRLTKVWMVGAAALMGGTISLLLGIILLALGIVLTAPFQVIRYLSLRAFLKKVFGDEESESEGGDVAK